MYFIILLQVHLLGGLGRGPGQNLRPLCEIDIPGGSEVLSGKLDLDTHLIIVSSLESLGVC